LCEKILGNKTKKIQYEEKEMYKISRKSIYFNRSLNRGDKIKLEDIVCLRPNKGLSPMVIPFVIGKKTKSNVQKQELIILKNLSK
jgi:sialic acid synthase SpsE